MVRYILLARSLRSTVAQVTILAAVCLAFDCQAVSALPQPWRALFDSSGHGLIAALGWCFCSFRNPTLPAVSRTAKREMVLAAFVASLIDVDHFISALSFRLEDAVKLTSRPAAHSVLFGIAIVGLLAWCAPARSRLPSIVAYAFISHHLRDSIRRGLYFYPIGGNSPPLPYFSLYLPLQTLLPQALYGVFRKKSHTATSSDSIV